MEEKYCQNKSTVSKTAHATSNTPDFAIINRRTDQKSLNSSSFTGFGFGC